MKVACCRVLSSAIIFYCLLNFEFKQVNFKFNCNCHLRLQPHVFQLHLGFKFKFKLHVGFEFEFDVECDLQRHVTGLQDDVLRQAIAEMGPSVTAPRVHL